MQVIEKAAAIFFKTGRFCEEIAGFSVAPDIFHLTAPGGQSELFFEGDVGEVASARRRGPFVHGSAVGIPPSSPEPGWRKVCEPNWAFTRG